MAENRVQVELPTRQQALRPQARPVDRFAPDIDTSKRQLGAALQNLAGSLQKGGAALAKGMREDELNALKPEARILSRDYNRFLTFEYARSDVKDTKDPEVQARWLADTEQKFFEKYGPVNPKVVAIARPAMNGAMDNISTRLAGDAVNAHYDSLEKTVSREAQQVVNNYNNLTPEQRTQELVTVYSGIVGNGLSPSRARAAVAKEWLARAVSSDNIKMVDELESFTLANGAKLVDPDVRNQMASAKEKIRNNRWTARQRFWQLEEREKADQTSNIGLRVAEKIATMGGGANLDEELSAALSLGNPDAVRMVRTMQTAVGDTVNNPDDSAFATIMGVMKTDPAMSDPKRAPALLERYQKTFNLSGEQMGNLYREYHRNLQSGRSGGASKFSKDPILKEALKTLDAAITVRNVKGHIEENELGWLQANIAFRGIMTQYDEENPDAKPAERNAYITSAVKNLTEAYARRGAKALKRGRLEALEAGNRRIDQLYPGADLFDFDTDEDGEPVLPWDQE